MSLLALLGLALCIYTHSGCRLAWEEEGLAAGPVMPFSSSQETMPQMSVVFSSILGPSCSGQVQPGMGERGSGAGGSGDLVFQEGRLISGSLEALMEHLVPTVDYYPDVSA